VDDLLEAPATLAVTALGKAEPVRAVRPHPVAHVETGGHVRLQLPDALGAVSGLDVSPLGLDEDVGVRLSMVGALVEDDDVRTFTRGTDPDSELRSAVGWRVLVLPYKRIFDVMPNVLFGGGVTELAGLTDVITPIYAPARSMS